MYIQWKEGYFLLYSSLLPRGIRYIMHIPHGSERFEAPRVSGPLLQNGRKLFSISENTC